MAAEEAACDEDAQEAISNASPTKARTEMKAPAFFKKPDATSTIPDGFFKRGPPRSGK
jgi:hypothetical protein